MASASKPAAGRTPADNPTWTRRETRLALGVAAVAIAVRALYLACFRHSVFFDHPVVNAAHYDDWALHGYPATEPFYQAPLYVAFLHLLYRLGDDAGRFWTVRLVQAFLGAATAVLAGVAAQWIVARFDPRRARLAAVVAGACCAVAAPLVYFDAEMLPGSLATFLLTASVVLLIRALRHDVAWPPSGWRGVVRWVWPGLVLGCAATNQPNVLLLVPLVALWLLRQRPTRPLAAATLVIAALLPVAGVTLRNARAGQGFVLVSTNYGDNLLLAHNPEADGLNPFPPAFVQARLDSLKQSGMNQVQRAHVAAADARTFMRQHPGRSIGLWLKKTWLFYNQHEIPNNRSIRRQAQQCEMLRWPPMAWIGAGLLLPLGLAGIACAFAAGVRGPFAVILVSAPVSFALFLVCARYRAPYLPVLAILAGVAVARFASRPPRRELAHMLLAVLAGAFVAWPNWYGVRRSEFPTLATNEAKLCRDVAEEERQRGDTAAADSLLHQARAALEQAVRDWPRAAQPRVWLGDLLLEQGDGAAAEQKYRQALAVDSRQAQAYAGLGRLLRVRDQYALALQQIDAAIAIEPNNAQWYILRGSTCFDARQFQAGVEAYEHALQIEEKSVSPAVDVRHIQAQIHLGRAMMFGGNSEPGPAEAELREAVGLEPANSLLTVQLARLLVGQKRHDDALQVIEACLQQPALRSVERAPLQQLLESLRRERGRAAPPDTSAAGPRRR